jgi:hypothetical protein
MYPARYHLHETVSFRLQLKTKRLRQIALHAAFCWSFLMPAFLHGQSLSHPYENPRFHRLYATLRQPSTLIAENLSLREILRAEEVAIQQPIWLDRRVDGEQIIKLESGQRTHLELLTLINSISNTETALLENIIYFSPANYVPRIETSYWNLYTGHENSLWRKTANPIEWKTSIEVGELMSLLEKQQGFPSPTGELIPHDRWTRGGFPSCSHAARWTCVLAGFDKTIDRDTGEKWKFVSMPAASNVRFEYSDLTKGYSKGELQIWRTKWPHSVVTPRAAGRFLIEAPVAAHRELVTMALDSKIKAQPNGKKKLDAQEKYSLTLKEWTIGVGLPTLAKQLGLEITPWPLPADVMNRQVELILKDVTIDEMLQRIGEQSKIKLKRVGNQIQAEWEKS